MSELILEEDEDRIQWVDPDPTGFTVRTQYKGTQDILDRNACSRNDAPSTFRQDGVDFHHAASIPMEVYEQMHIRLGRAPTARECLELANQRDFSKLKTRDAKL